MLQDNSNICYAITWKYQELVFIFHLHRRLEEGAKSLYDLCRYKTPWNNLDFKEPLPLEKKIKNYNNKFYWTVIYLLLEGVFIQLSTKSVWPSKFAGLKGSKADLKPSSQQKEEHSDILSMKLEGRIAL